MPRFASAPAPAVALGLALLPGSSPAVAQCVEGCNVIHEWVGENPGDTLGWVSNDVGDLDGDGVHDLVLTAPLNDAGGGNAGRVYAHSGATGELLFDVTGTIPGGWLGHDAAPAGDVNGDGVPDVIIGAPAIGAPGSNAGLAVLVSGVDGAEIHTFPGQNIGDRFGFRVWGEGDFDGDGTPDLVIGAPQHDTAGSNAGRAYVYSGATFLPLCTIDGLQTGAKMGSGVAFVGDVTGDGLDDVAIGAQDAPGGGRAYVYSKTSISCVQEYAMLPGSPAVDFGLWFMNGGHDVNLDGTPDIYVNDFSVNRAHIFSGVDGSSLWTLNGANEGGGFGIGRLIRDMNGDGHADAVLAAWVNSTGAPQAGKTFIYSGKDASILETFTHDIAGAGFGFDANGMGDVNGDGKRDYLITAAQDNAGGGRGVCYLIAGTIAPVDFDGSGSIDVADLITLILNWGDCPKDGSPCIGDTNEDGTVDVEDLVALLVNWS